MGGKTLMVVCLLVPVIETFVSILVPHPRLFLRPDNGREYINGSLCLLVHAQIVT